MNIKISCCMIISACLFLVNSKADSTSKIWVTINSISFSGHAGPGFAITDPIDIVAFVGMMEELQKIDKANIPLITNCDNNTFHTLANGFSTHSESVSKSLKNCRFETCGLISCNSGPLETMIYFYDPGRKIEFWLAKQMKGKKILGQGSQLSEQIILQYDNAIIAFHENPDIDIQKPVRRDGDTIDQGEEIGGTQSGATESSAHSHENSPSELRFRLAAVGVISLLILFLALVLISKKIRRKN